MTTDTITLPRATVEQALEAFEFIRTSTSLADVRDRAAFAASRLTAALEAKEREAEPVAWEYVLHAENGTILTRRAFHVNWDERYQPFGSPGIDFDSTYYVTKRPLSYTTPQQPQVPEGWQLVPVEPFNEALDILKKVRDGELGNCVAYRMLVAAAIEAAKKRKEIQSDL